MKKLILSLALVAASVFQASAFQLYTTNVLTGTTVVFTARASVYQIDVNSAGVNLVKFYDTASNALTYVVGAYTGSSNFALQYTNLQTNAILVYSSSTQYLIQTNVYTGTSRTNYTVAQSTNAVPTAVTLFVPANTTASLDAVDMNFVNGITVTTTNAATIVIYTR